MTDELLATHQILSLFERSKFMSDQILDNLSGLFANLTAQGQILRANGQLASLVGLSLEDVLNTNLNVLFTESDWPVFQAHVKTVSESGKPSPEFELSIGTGAQVRSYLWQILPLVVQKRAIDDQVFTCTGRDVTAVKQALALAKDLELSKAIQTLLLPKFTELSTPRFELAAIYEPATTIGGDFWWMESIGDEKIWIIVGDVTGHGAAAAMVTSMVAGSIRSLVSNTPPEQLNLTKMLSGINQCLYGLEGQPYWMTATALEIDLGRGQVSWWGAAMPPLFVQTAQGKIDVISKMSAHLGTDSEDDFESGQFAFQVGDRLLALTDGVFEATGPTGTQYGIRRVDQFLRSVEKLPVYKVRDELIKSVYAWSGDQIPEDDITFVLFERKA
jgi:serine phosphatase RsbU (regulator of sigma subunit)